MDTIDTVDTSSLVPPAKKVAQSSRPRAWRAISSWLLTWEMYPIVAVAIFLRFCFYTSMGFGSDQAQIFSMAGNAVAHGLIPVTANLASINILNPPATIYLLMMGAVFSLNPYSGLVVTGVLNVLAVILTYAVIRRYYGRLAGSTTAVFYAMAQLPVFYSRFIWNQNLLAPFIPLFLFALLWGVVERRRGWLAPTVLLWGWMIQLHGSAVFLAIPLALACILAFKTLRWRDVFLAAGLLVLIFSPYIVWEWVTHFADVPVLLRSLGQKSKIDGTALHAYLDFLSPYPGTPIKSQVWEYKLYGLLHWVRRGMIGLVFCAFVFALLAVCQNRWKMLSFVPRGAKVQANAASRPATFEGRLKAWVTDFLSTPWRRGLLVLLAWQILPVMILSRHSLRIFDYYLLVLMPGPFILLGIFTAQLAEWLRSFRFPWPLARYAFYLLLVVLALGLSVGSVTRSLDEADGYNYHGVGGNTLHDELNALHEADRLAQAYDIHHVYIALDHYTRDPLSYLAQQMRTPYTTYEASNCLPLPGPTQGPAIMLFGPADSLNETLLTHFTSARLVSVVSRLSGPPYHLYIVQPSSSQLNGSTFTDNLALTAGQAEPFTWENPFPNPSVMTPQTPVAQSMLLTRWNLLRTASPAFGTSYTYKLRASYTGNGMDGRTSEQVCSASGFQSGEQLLVAFALPKGSTGEPVSLSISGTSWITTPYSPSVGPLHLETFLHRSTPEVPLQPSNGTISLSVSKG